MADVPLPCLAAAELLGRWMGGFGVPDTQPIHLSERSMPKPSAGTPARGSWLQTPLLTPGPSVAQPLPDRAWGPTLLSISTFIFEARVRPGFGSALPRRRCPVDLLSMKTNPNEPPKRWSQQQGLRRACGQTSVPAQGRSAGWGTGTATRPRLCSRIDPEPRSLRGGAGGSWPPRSSRGS